MGLFNDGFILTHCLKRAFCDVSFLFFLHKLNYKHLFPLKAGKEVKELTEYVFSLERVLFTYPNGPLPLKSGAKP